MKKKLGEAPNLSGILRLKVLIKSIKYGAIKRYRYLIKVELKQLFNCEFTATKSVIQQSQIDFPLTFNDSFDVLIYTTLLISFLYFHN